jgi:hypothetical protein
MYSTYPRYPGLRTVGLACSPIDRLLSNRIAIYSLTARAFLSARAAMTTGFLFALKNHGMQVQIRPRSEPDYISNRSCEYAGNASESGLPATTSTGSRILHSALPLAFRRFLANCASQATWRGNQAKFAESSATTHQRLVVVPRPQR